MISFRHNYWLPCQDIIGHSKLIGNLASFWYCGPELLSCLPIASCKDLIFQPLHPWMHTYLMYKILHHNQQILDTFMYLGFSMKPSIFPAQIFTLGPALGEKLPYLVFQDQLEALFRTFIRKILNIAELVWWFPLSPPPIFVRTFSSAFSDDSSETPSFFHLGCVIFGGGKDFV